MKVVTMVTCFEEEIAKLERDRAYHIKALEQLDAQMQLAYRNHAMAIEFQEMTKKDNK